MPVIVRSDDSVVHPDVPTSPPPACRSSLRRIQNARKTWEEHRRRQEQQQQQRPSAPSRGDDGASHSSSASSDHREDVSVSAPTTTTENNATVLVGSDRDAKAGAVGTAADERNILRARKTKGSAQRQNTTTIAPSSSSTVPTNPFANIRLATGSSSSTSKPPAFAFVGSVDGDGAMVGIKSGVNVSRNDDDNNIFGSKGSFASGSGGGDVSASSFSFAVSGSNTTGGGGNNMFGSAGAFGNAGVGIAFGATNNSTNPFVGAKKNTTGKSNSGGGGGSYPPMSLSAPKPLGLGTVVDQQQRGGADGSKASAVPSGPKGGGAGGGYPPMPAAAPKPFTKPSTGQGGNDNASEKSNNASPFSSVPSGEASSLAKSPFSFAMTASGDGSSSKNMFGGSTSVFGSATSDPSGGTGTGFAFASGKNSTPFGAAPSSVSPSPFGAPPAAGGGSAFGGFGKSNSNPFSSDKGTSTAHGGQSYDGGGVSHGDSSNTSIDYKAKLTEFYREHNPSKVSAVESNLAKYEGKEDELFRKLYQKYGLTPEGEKNPFDEPGGTGSRAYLDISMGGNDMGRIVVQLYSDRTPITAENFRALCAGSTKDKHGTELNLPKTYAGNAFHRIVTGCFQGGDITLGNGRGGRSIYPPNDPDYGTDAWGKFRDEIPFMAHSKRGLLSMANAGANQNSSQFFITMRPLPYLNGKHVVFGEVLEPKNGYGDMRLGDGMKVLDRIMESVRVDPKNDRPKEDCRVVIEACGEIV